MKQKFTLLFALICLSLALSAQKNKSGQKNKKFSLSAPGQKKPSLFGINFSLSDFNAPKNFGKNSNASTLAISDMSAGVSLSYWKGLTPFIDFSAKLHGVFHDYSALYNNLPGKTEIGLQLEPTLNIRPLRDENIFSPYLLVGAGIGLYTNRGGAYIPMGGGLQFNASSITYFFLQAQYNATLTPKVVPDNLMFSLGFAQNVSGDDGAYQAPKPTLPVAKVVVLDRDGDGVNDDVDECPDVKGLAAFKGCPDSDGDGIPDAQDKCPTVKGTAKYNGCPVPDSDGDGINDDDDKCPTVPGIARYQGCPMPDRDKDGVADEDDKCPDEAGPASNAGCPLVDNSDILKINDAAAHILFATGSAKLLPASFAPLDQVAAIMKQHGSYKLDVSGHTDNVGDRAKNKALSVNRVNAVRDYLVSKGIDGSRISAAGYGDEKPVADNKTAAGRAKNRRVEMKVSPY